MTAPELDAAAAARAAELPRVEGADSSGTGAQGSKADSSGEVDLGPGRPREEVAEEERAD